MTNLGQYTKFPWIEIVNPVYVNGHIDTDYTVGRYAQTQQCWSETIKYVFAIVRYSCNILGTAKLACACCLLLLLCWTDGSCGVSEEMSIPYLIRLISESVSNSCL